MMKRIETGPSSLPGFWLMEVTKGGQFKSCQKGHPDEAQTLMGPSEVAMNKGVEEFQRNLEGPVINGPPPRPNSFLGKEGLKKNARFNSY